MPYKSIQGPFVLSLALAALVAGASGAPQLDDVRKQAAQPLRSQSAHTASQSSRDGGFDTSALAPIERDLARLRRYEPLAASDLVTNSVDGADSTIALRGSIGNGDALSYSLAVAPRHGRVTINNGRATYRPDPDFVGVDTYTYRVHAGQDSAEAVVAVTSIRERSLPATAAAAL
ncbi:Ig-like domain-containing protein [Lysobacter sp. TAB13]|uniref:Ig-like domain-containing protein n=1 Tax=Lysobacter sp. TAB13 TaxID=3233065 RepID=UPI003F9C19AB